MLPVVLIEGHSAEVTRLNTTQVEGVLEFESVMIQLKNEQSARPHPEFGVDCDVLVLGADRQSGRCFVDFSLQLDLIGPEEAARARSGVDLEEGDHSVFVERHYFSAPCAEDSEVDEALGVDCIALVDDFEQIFEFFISSLFELVEVVFEVEEVEREGIVVQDKECVLGGQSEGSVGLIASSPFEEVFEARGLIWGSLSARFRYNFNFSAFDVSLRGCLLVFGRFYRWWNFVDFGAESLDTVTAVEEVGLLCIHNIIKRV